MVELGLILVGAVLANNFVLVKFLGLCPFFGASARMDTALGMSFATTFVLTLACAVGSLLALLVRLSRAGAEILWGFEDRRERFPSPGLQESLARMFEVRPIVHPDDRHRFVRKLFLPRLILALGHVFETCLICSVCLDKKLVFL